MMADIILDDERVTFEIGITPSVKYQKTRVLDLQDREENEMIVKESSELGDSLKELNDDSISDNNKMSGIDLRSRLHFIEISSILAVDTLVGFKFLPLSCLVFTRQKKRLAVSLNGEGRREIVDVVGRKRDGDIEKGSGGFMNKIGRAFGAGKNEN